MQEIQIWRKYEDSKVYNYGEHVVDDEQETLY